MCIGIPMQVQSLSPGHAVVAGRGEERRVNTALVEALQPGDWVLVFLDGVRERISAGRAAEVNATLDLVADAMGAGPSCGATLAEDPAFTLPSAMSAEQLAALTGGARA